MTISRCEDEPIHIPGSIQPHGALVALDLTDRRVSHVSENVGSFLPDESAANLLGKTLNDIKIFKGDRYLSDAIFADSIKSFPVNAGVVPHGGHQSDLLVHRNHGRLFLEFERTPAATTVNTNQLYASTRSFVDKLRDVSEKGALYDLVAKEVRNVTRFNRVLIYKFLSDWSGVVVGEDRDEVLPSYDEHHFPAGDIPAQARALYRQNPVRIIPNASYDPVSIFGKGVLDLTYSVLRSVSPIHVEYMKNMETQSSMSVSIIKDGELWGLISCHNRAAKHLSYETRHTCEFISQIFALQLSALEHERELVEKIEVKSLHTELLRNMADATDVAKGLLRDEGALLSFTRAQGCSLIFADKVTSLGLTPNEAEVRRFVEWLVERGEPQFISEAVGRDVSDQEPWGLGIAGVLAVRLAKAHKSFLIWYRREVTYSIKWAGEPGANGKGGGAGSLHPRNSFKMWQETVKGKSEPWTTLQIEAALELRNSIVGIILKSAEELGILNEELTRANKELEAFSYSVSHDLRGPFRHIVGYSELLRELEGPGMSEEGRRYVETIIESAQYAGILVDSLLSLSRMSRTQLSIFPVDVDKLVREVVRELSAETEGKNVDWVVDKLPTADADLMMLRLVFWNLLSNAVKYSAKGANPRIHVTAEEGESETIFSVEDNGVGFDMKYEDKLFGVFQRLHRPEDFAGTGIGLANVRRVISRHGGRTWATGEVGKGARFFFSLPKNASEG